MGLIGKLFAGLFGGGLGAIREVAEVFTPNAEAEAGREHAEYAAALAQYAKEFRGRPGILVQLVDFVNRLPRPAMAMGTLFLFAEAMRDPLGFAESMQGLQAVPEPLWWLLGAIVSFYFGARELQKFREARPPSAEEARAIVESIRAIRELRAPPRPPAPEPVPPIAAENPALAAWAAGKG